MRISSVVTFPSEEKATVTVIGGQKGSIAATIMVVSSSSGQAWSAAFTASYVAQLTSKAGGNASISFIEFVSAIQAAVTAGSKYLERKEFLEGSSAAVEWQLDLLSSADLQQLRLAKTGTISSRSGASEPPEPDADSDRNGRRYLIVTRTCGSNRVHYPLPLDPVTALSTTPDTPEAKPQTDSVRRLRDRLERLRRENALLVEENQRLSAGATEAAELRVEAAKLGAVARAARLKLDDRRRRKRIEAEELARLRAEVAELRTSEREARKRLLDAESALAGHRAAVVGKMRGQRAASLERHVAWQREPLESPRTPQPQPHRKSPSSLEQQPPWQRSRQHSRRRMSPPPNPALAPAPYEEDIADIDKRLEQLRCFLDKALVPK